jgi:hypothetical protein
VWGVIPDFWSISGSGLILGGAIWVAVAKARIKHDGQDDVERGGYTAVMGEEDLAKENEFELGDLEEREDVPAGLSSPASPRARDSEELERDSGNIQKMDAESLLQNQS